MDIFTTQLTRVVPVPIKPEKLRVKAPSKEGAIKQVNKENNSIAELCYLVEYEEGSGDGSGGEHESSSHSSNDKIASSHSELSEKKQAPDNEGKGKEEDQEPPHLDIYV